eukprot:SAG22_NODE_8284_length_667_cov_1.156690_1_plen_29_part_01
MHWPERGAIVDGTSIRAGEDKGDGGGPER